MILPSFGSNLSPARVQGTIHANRVKLNSSAIVEGDIFHRSLSIDENARFEGSSRRQETVTDAPRIPLSQPEAQADIHNLAAMEGNRNHNGPIENKWRPSLGGGGQTIEGSEIPSV